MRKLCRKIITSNTINGDRSMPILGRGKVLLTRLRTGSVTLYRNLTIGLYGSGLTHEMRADMMISHMYIDRMTFSTCAIAPIKLPSTYMILLVTPQTSMNTTHPLRQRVGPIVL